MHRRRLWILVGCGPAVAVVGFLWGGFLTGVPYQDATAGQQAGFTFHSNVALWLLCAGVALATVGILGLVLARLRDIRCRQP